MKNIDHMIKCRCVFLYNIGLMYEDFTVLDDERLYMLLDSFLKDYIENCFETFNLIYYFNVEEDNLCIYEDPLWHETLKKNLNYFMLNDTKNVLKIYDDLGYDTVSKLNELVELFYGYVAVLSDMNNLKIRS